MLANGRSNGVRELSTQVRPPRAFPLPKGQIFLRQPLALTVSRIVSGYSAIMSRPFKMSSSHTHHEPSSSLAAPGTEQKVESISTHANMALRL